MAELSALNEPLEVIADSSPFWLELQLLSISFSLLGSYAVSVSASS